MAKSGWLMSVLTTRTSTTSTKWTALTVSMPPLATALTRGMWLWLSAIWPIKNTGAQTPCRARRAAS